MTEQWIIYSLDYILGVVGGLASIVWGTLLILFGSYESFKLENSLISKIYETRPQSAADDDSSDDYDDEQKAKLAMIENVTQRGYYYLNFTEYILSAFLRTFCRCCCKNFKWYSLRIKRLSRHELA